MLETLRDFCDSRPGTCLFILLLGLTLLAYSNRFVQDDAFISFRYADHFIRGDGLVWNEGERVEGYTNFLWTLLMAVPLRLGIDPVGFSFGAGMAAFILSLVFTYRLAVLILASTNAALLAVLLLGTNHTFSAYATGGLETQWQACLFIGTVLLLVEGLRSKSLSAGRLGLLSCMLGTAVLTRVDSAVLVAWAYAIAGLVLIRENGPRRHRLARIIAVTVPFLVITGGWFFWKLWYYGSVLPNTFYAKEPSPVHVARGLYYLGAFLLVYWLIPFPIVFPFLLKRRWPHGGPGFGVLSVAALVVAWSAYVIFVGGDFMEFRFVVPVLPCVSILITWTIVEFTSVPPIRIALALLVISGSVFQSNLEAIRGMQTIEGLSQPVAEWRRAGEILGRSFGEEPDVTIATTAAGTIPFYSRLKTIDMAGLSDRWVARHGTRVASGSGAGPKIGHQRLATLQYLLERRVNLVLAHPRIVGSGDLATSEYSLNDLDDWSPALEPTDANQVGVLLGAKIIEIPIQADRKLVALYLVRNSTVDRAIKANGWGLHPISRD